MSFELAKEKAVKYLVVAKKTEFEVRKKLLKSGFEEKIIEEVLEYLKKIKYIDDEDYVDAYIRQCMRLLNYSIYEIKQKLLQKGIKKCIIEKKLEILKNNGYESDLVKKLINGKCKNMDELKKKQYIYRRGIYIVNREDI
ncbi:MAG: regulatory protein RecX [Clostridia bacterium]